MSTFALCLAALLCALLAWSAVTGHTLIDRLRFEGELARLGHAAQAPGADVRRVRPATLYRVLLDPARPDWLKERAAHGVLRVRGRRRLARDAAGKSPFGTRWQRIGAWHALYRTGTADLHGFLRGAVVDADPIIVFAAVAMLGKLGDRAAVAILVAGWCERDDAGQCFLMQIDRCRSADVLAVMQPLLGDARARVRAGAVALLGRHPAPGMDRRIGMLADDPDPAVRKAVARAMGELCSPHGLVIAARLLHDPEAYVRAHAVRALHRIVLVHPVRLSGLLAPLRADHDWWVRLAVREADASVAGRVYGPMYVGTRPGQQGGGRGHIA